MKIKSFNYKCIRSHQFVVINKVFLVKALYPTIPPVSTPGIFKFKSHLKIKHLTTNTVVSTEIKMQ